MPPSITQQPAPPQKSSTLIWAWASVAIAIVVAAGGLGAYYLYLQSRPVTSPTGTVTPPIANNLPPTDPTPSLNDVQPRNPSELTKLVYVRYANPDQAGGDIEVYTSSATESGKVTDERKLFTIKHNGYSPARATVSPNGQFIAVTLNDFVEERGYDLENSLSSAASNRVIVFDNGGQEIAMLRQGTKFLTSPVWSDDSKKVYFSEISYPDPIGPPDSSLIWYDVETNVTGQQIAALAADAPNRPLQPLEIHGNLLFALAQAIGSEDPGIIYALTLMADGTPTGETKKLLDLSISSRGYDIAEDGSGIVLARGGLEQLGGSEQGPYTLEMFDRTTGKTTILRTSDTEKFAAPIFFGGQQFVYGTQDGIFTMRTPDQKVTKVFDAKTLDSQGEEFRPITVRPDGERVVFQVIGNEPGFRVYAADLEVTDADDSEAFIAIDFEPYYVIWGWTESLDRPF